MIGELLTSRVRMIAIASVLALAALLPLFVDEFSVLVLNQCLIWGILALSLDLMLGYTGMASLGHAAYFGTGAYATAIMSATYGASFGEAFVVAIIAAAVVTAICALVALRASDVYFLMITFALAMIIWGLAYRWIR